MPYNEFQKIVDEIVQSDIVVLEEYSTENGYDENFDVTDIHIPAHENITLPMNLNMIMV